MLTGLQEQHWEGDDDNMQWTSVEHVLARAQLPNFAYEQLSPDELFAGEPRWHRVVWSCCITSQSRAQRWTVLALSSCISALLTVLRSD